MNTTRLANSTIGPQPATFSYLAFNPTFHTREKAYEILINLPLASVNPQSYHRSNEEFEQQSSLVNALRGQESEFGLDLQVPIWRKWEGPDEWRGVDGKVVKSWI